MKKIKYILGIGIIGAFFSSCFGFTIIRQSNGTNVNNIQSFNYYDDNCYYQDSQSVWVYDYGFGHYTDYDNGIISNDGLLNNNTFLNSSLESVSGYSYLYFNCFYSRYINIIPTFKFDVNGNIIYTPVFSNFSCDGNTTSPGSISLYFSNSGSFGTLDLSANPPYIHLIGSNYNKNPGIVQNTKFNHYYFLTTDKIYSDYGFIQDVPSGLYRKKYYNSLGHTISSILMDSNSFVSFASTDSLQWSNGQLNIWSHSGFLVLHFNNYLDSQSDNGTIVLSMSGTDILYNYYDSSLYNISSIQSTTPSQVGKLFVSSGNVPTLFAYFLNDGGTYFEVVGSIINSNLTFRSYRTGFKEGSTDWQCTQKAYTDYTFNLTSDSDIPVIIPGGGNGSQSNYSGSVSLNNCIDTQICWDFTGSDGRIIRTCTTKCVSSGVIASGGYIGSDGTYYFVNSPISIEDSLKTDNPENMFTGSYIDSGGILSLSYFTDYFQPGAKKVGVCPFKYYEGPLDFMTKLKIGDVYLLMPVLCFYSAFQQGKNVSFFDQYNLNDGLFSQPMLYGESDNHKLLFAFFDVLFSIGLLGLIRYLSRHLF